MTPLAPLVLVLCRYDERGQGRVYREGDCAFWFASKETWTAWVKERPLPEKFYVYPLRNLSAQLDHLKLFKKDGIIAVVHPDAGRVAIDTLIARVAAESGKESDIGAENEC